MKVQIEKINWLIIHRKTGKRKVCPAQKILQTLTGIVLKTGFL
jgi:hypothetical protein